MLLLLILMLMVMMSMFLLVGMKMKESKSKSSSYECGFESKMSARKIFSLRFFLISVLFLLFDVEVVLMIPIPKMVTMLSFWVYGMFMVVLFVGLVYEINIGSIEWLGD